MLSRLFRKSRASGEPRGAVPPGRRVYAIGDVHGRADLLEALLAAIDADDDARPAAETSLIFLGDLVDRGPQSAEVVERVRALAAASPAVRCLKGNHEEVFLDALGGDEKVMRFFCRIGGHETCLSYGVTDEEYEHLPLADLAARLAALVPESHRAFLESCEDLIAIGDYAFVHAGVRPGVELDAQETNDLRWIRDRFLDHRGDHGAVIVHGHTITEAPEFRPNRIGIDTGAYAGGQLTALGLEGDERWIVAVGGDERATKTSAPGQF